MIPVYKKIPKGQALIRTGAGGTNIAFDALWYLPFVHILEVMDISIKRIEIDRSGRNGLICKDNIRADIKVAFFVRVNPTPDDVKRVALGVGCERASSADEIRNLFDAKFSEALKTVGKRFNFTELYEERDTFRDEIIKVIGTNLNGFILDDASIDFLEQTPVELLDPDNILDAEGIKKITELTAEQAKLSNQITRDKEKVLRQQDVAAREAILELERQLAETEAKQAREVATVKSREEAEAAKVAHEERLKSSQAQIATDEALAIAEENKLRVALVAQRAKERTDAVELERIERERDLERIERERLTALKEIEREKAVEAERKSVQEIIRERVMVEKGVVEEQQKIKDTEELATAERAKKVAVTEAAAAAESAVISKTKEAEAARAAAEQLAEQEAFAVLRAATAGQEAAKLRAQERIIAAEAEETAAAREAAAKKALAEAIAKESAALGLGEAEVVRAKGSAEAEAVRARGLADAEAAGARGKAEADAIEVKAAAMKLFEEAGQAHEEFKLRLDKDKAIELAEVQAQVAIAAQQANALGKAFETANIDIVGGDGQFFDQISRAIARGKAIDRTVTNSKVLSDVKETFFNGDPEHFKTQLQSWIQDFGIPSEDLKNLSIAAALTQLAQQNPDQKSKAQGLLALADRFGLSGKKVGEV